MKDKNGDLLLIIALCINACVESHTIPLSAGGSEKESMAWKVLSSNRHFLKVKYITQNQVIINELLAGPHYTKWETSTQNSKH